MNCYLYSYVQNFCSPQSRQRTEFIYSAQIVCTYLVYFVTFAYSSFTKDTSRKHLLNSYLPVIIPAACVIFFQAHPRACLINHSPGLHASLRPAAPQLGYHSPTTPPQLGLASHKVCRTPRRKHFSSTF